MSHHAPFLPADTFSEQLNIFCRSWHHSASCCSSVTLFLPCHSTMLAAHFPAPLSPGAQRASCSSVPVPSASAWRVWAQSTELTWGGRTLSPRTVLLDGPGVILFPTTEKLDRRGARGSQPPQDCISLHSWKEKFTERKKEELRALLHAYR